MKKPAAFTYVDLFAGCGGLSLGVESSGGELILAVEKSPMAAETFYHNLVSSVENNQWSKYLEKTVSQQIQSSVLVDEVAALLSEPEELSRMKDLQIDLVAGGPPCQGFSLAGRRNKNDVRNQLPWQFLEIVEKLSPKFVVIENVVGMRHKFSAGDNQSTFDSLAQALEETGEGYLVQKIQANAVHYGAAQNRPRLLLVAARNDLVEQLGISASDELWFSDFADKIPENIPPLAPRPTAISTQIPTVNDALSDQLAGKNSSYLRKLRSGLFRATTHNRTNQNHVTRTHSERTIVRFRLYQLIVDRGLSPLLLKDGLNGKELESRNNQIEELEKLNFPVLDRKGAVIARNAGQLKAMFDELKTFKHSQRVLELEKPAPTIVTAADDYIHPVEPRVLTVRELARFQGFPESFEFRAKETTGGLKRRHEVPQYSQVGNAVSPFVGLAIGEMIRGILSDHGEK